MASNPTPPPTSPSIDDLYSQFKTLEGQLTTDQGAQAGAASAVTTAQSNLANANTAVGSDQTQIGAVGTQLVSAIQAFLAANAPPASS